MSVCSAVRLLFNHEHILKNDIVEAPQSERLLFQTRYIDMFVVLAREAAKRGILVMIGCHRITHDAWPGDGLWYGSYIGVPRVLESWTALTRALCGEWNVFAADLQNEPHSSSWGKGLPTDWNKAAEQIGNHVSKECPRWMIMVEGVGYTPGAPGGDDPGAGFWWGENLVGTRVAPVRLNNQDKLVYSPHVYGPSVYLQSYFKSPFFPNNMPAVWQQHFAFAQEKTGRPIVIGEFGGDYTGADRVWQDWAIPYMIQQGFGLFYFALNPDSKDTGGLVPRSDWSDPPPNSPEALKLEALAQLPSTDVFQVCPACRPADAAPLQSPPSPPSPPLPRQAAPEPSRSSASSALATHAPPLQTLPPPPPPDVQETAASVSSSSPEAPFLSDPLSAGASLLLLYLIGRHFVRNRRDSGGLQPVEAVPCPTHEPEPEKAQKPRKAGKKSGGRQKGASAAEGGEADAESAVLLLQHGEPEPDGPWPTGTDLQRESPDSVVVESAEGATLSTGDRVRVHGLSQEPWHNGVEGVVAGHAQTPSGPRFNIVCQKRDGSSVGLCLKLENLERIPPPQAADQRGDDAQSDVGSSVSYSAAARTCSRI